MTPRSFAIVRRQPHRVAERAHVRSGPVLVRGCCARLLTGLNTTVSSARRSGGCSRVEAVYQGAAHEGHGSGRTGQRLTPFGLAISRNPYPVRWPPHRSGSRPFHTLEGVQQSPVMRARDHQDRRIGGRHVIQEGNVTSARGSGIPSERCQVEKSDARPATCLDGTMPG